MITCPPLQSVPACGAAVVDLPWAPLLDTHTDPLERNAAIAASGEWLRAMASGSICPIVVGEVPCCARLEDNKKKTDQVGQSEDRNLTALTGVQPITASREPTAYTGPATSSRDTYPAAQLAPPPISISQRVLQVAL